MLKTDAGGDVRQLLLRVQVGHKSLIHDVRHLAHDVDVLADVAGEIAPVTNITGGKVSMKTKNTALTEQNQKLFRN